MKKGRTQEERNEIIKKKEKNGRTRNKKQEDNRILIDFFSLKSTHGVSFPLAVNFETVIPMSNEHTLEV